MFYLVGAGLKKEHLTIEAIETLKKCDEVFIEEYTSLYSEGNVKELGKIIGKKLRFLGRNGVEEWFEGKLPEAKEKDIALITIGNALFATTHIQLLIDAENAGVKWRVVQGISIHNFLGRTGLNAYNFGLTVSIVMHSKNYKPESFYDKIVKNLEAGLHTLCLLDIKPEKKMSVEEALDLLLQIEKKRGKNKIKNSEIVALAGMGSFGERVVSGSAEKLKELNLPVPASIVVCAKLSDKELEALNALTERLK